MRWPTISLLCLSGFLQAYALPKKAATNESHFVGTPCSGQHQQFTCQSVSGNGCPAPGKFVPGFCKGSANIQCCVQPAGTSPGTGATQQSQPSSQFADTTLKDDLEEEDCDEEVPPQQPGGTNAPAQPGKPSPNPASPSKTVTPNTDGKQPGSSVPSGGKKSATATVKGNGVLQSVQHKDILGTLPLFHRDFAPSVLKLIDCLPEGKQIYSTSSSRTFNNPSSNHRAGMAWDTNVKDSSGVCDRNCMFRARKSGSGPFGWFKEFVQCAENNGVRHLGSQPAFNDGSPNEEGHFEIDDRGKWSARNSAIQAAMRQWCSGGLKELPPRVGDNASDWACRGV